MDAIERIDIEDALSATEWAELNTHEEIIERGLSVFTAVGNALAAIRDARLYRATHSTFEDYCRERWGFSRQRAHQFIDAAAVMANLSTIVDILPANEAQARELVGLPADEQRAVWGEFIKEAEEKGYTATELRRMVRCREAIREGRSDRQETPPLPPGVFDLIYADPAWRYDFSNSSGRAVENQYPTMRLEDICALGETVRDHAHRDCVLFLWATVPKLPEAFQVLDAWEFTYKSCAVWRKNGLGMGYWWRIDTELLLTATRGAPRTPPDSERISNVIEAPKTGHSEKPEAVRALLEQLYPNARRLEMYARGEPRPGWTLWGNEVTATEGLAAD